MWRQRNLANGNWGWKYWLFSGCYKAEVEMLSIDLHKPNTLTPALSQKERE
jgi:hypothetical protein